jgi:signal transduction histidine kinase
MMAGLSLRGRLVLGAILWTVGLFAVTGSVLTWLMFRPPQSPSMLHNLFMHTLLTSMVALACMIAGLWQVKRGLMPFERLRAYLARVKDGRANRVEGVYPAEVQPLVEDLNALLDQRERAVARAQAKAGDLAHGLKTPLAVMMHEADRLESGGLRDLAGAIAHQTERMRRQIDYHLAHARAAASGATLGARSVLLESSDGLARTLRRLYGDRGLTIDLDVPVDLCARVQREDLDEMLGNLLDNGCKWARSHVRLAAHGGDGRVVVHVDDDGPGIEPSMRATVLQRGVRADQAAPGSGLGLAIVRDLAELYGGTIALSTAPTGGLRARLDLPAC